MDTPALLKLDIFLFKIFGLFLTMVIYGNFYPDLSCGVIDIPSTLTNLIAHSGPFRVIPPW